MSVNHRCGRHPRRFFFFFSFHLKPMGLNVAILPVITKDLPSSPRFTPYEFLSRCNFSTLTTRQPKVKVYLLTFAVEERTPIQLTRIELTTSALTSRCAGYLLEDHSADEGASLTVNKQHPPISAWGRDCEYSTNDHRNNAIFHCNFKYTTHPCRLVITTTVLQETFHRVIDLYIG